MQWQIAMWLRRNCWQCRLSCRSAAGTNTFNFTGFRLFVCCVFSGLCNDLITLYEESYHVRLSLTDLGTSTTVTLALCLAAAPQKEGNIKFTYRTSNCNWCLLPAPQQCCWFSDVGPFIGHISEWAARVHGQHILPGTPDMCDSTVFSRNYKEVLP